MEWIILAVVVGLIVIWVLATYNSLVKSRNKTQESWAQIATQLQRRFDLIPNLVETVKKYADHERATFNAITEARAEGQKALASNSPAAAAEAEKHFTSALGNINALAEAYPDLKASANFSQLQEELATTENKVAFARQSYNDSVFQYNTKRQSAPTNIIAGMFKFEDAELFDVEDEEARKAPKVNFD